MNKTRTLLVAMSIAVGVFAVGAMAGAREIGLIDLKAQYSVTNDRSAIITAFPLDEDFIRSVRQMDGVKDAEGRDSTIWPVFIGNQRKDAWLQVIGDFEHVQINQWEYVSGAKTPPMREVLLDRNAADYFKLSVGDNITLELPNGKKRDLRIAGIVHDVNAPPISFTNLIVTYMSLDTWEWLGNPRTFSSMRFIVSENATDFDSINAIAMQIKKRVQDDHRRWIGASIQSNPGKHFGEDPLTAISLILTVIGVLALFLSAFLVVNTVNSVMAQQIRQVGIMKAVGAQTYQIAGMYLTMVLVYGVLGLIIGVPLGIIGAQGLARFMGNLLNFDIFDIFPPTWVLGIQAAVGLVVPVVAALIPVLSGTRVPTRIAMMNTGISESNSSNHELDEGTPSRLNALVHRFSLRPILLSIRNTFRRKARLALTLVTLTLASAMFIAVFSVRSSLDASLDETQSLLNYDIEVLLTRNQTEATIIREASAVPGITAVEVWNRNGANLINPDGTDGRSVRVMGIPPDTQRLNVQLMDGRWLSSEDIENVVINQYVSNDNPHIHVGSDFELKFGNRVFRWRVVGIMKDAVASPVGNPSVVYMSQSGYRQILSVGRQASSFVVVTTQHDGDFQATVSREIEERFKRVNLPVAATTTTTDRVSENRFTFNLLTTFLLMMAGILAIVGALGLTGTMSINVLERTREIGVMRAIGASNASVRGVIIVEGVVIGVISWAVGAVLAYPIMRLLNEQVGRVIIKQVPPHTYSWQGLWLWFFVVMLVALFASLMPAWRASRLTVREVLAYE